MMVGSTYLALGLTSRWEIEILDRGAGFIRNLALLS
jgi:hypothetical protein